MGSRNLLRFLDQHYLDLSASSHRTPVNCERYCHCTFTKKQAAHQKQRENSTEFAMLLYGNINWLVPKTTREDIPPRPQVEKCSLQLTVNEFIPAHRVYLINKTIH